jgi:4-hydroxy-2-oxoheptanedioate aldolase
MRPNKTKAKLLAGEQVFGINPDINHPDMVEVFGYVGYDYVFLDCEHSSYIGDGIIHCIRAAYATDITPLVRVPANFPHIILEYLELGAQGVIVPHVNTKEQAQAVVSAVKYGPLGKRGWGGLKAHEYRIRASKQESTEESNKETLVVIMIEEVEAVENLSEILAVEGIDVCFFGPGDLSQSMGYPGQYDHPVVLETIDRAIAQTVDAGRVAGTLISTDNFKKYLKLGVRFHYTHIMPCIISGARGFLEVTKGA